VDRIRAHRQRSCSHDVGASRSAMARGGATGRGNVAPAWSRRRPGVS
jgi:hypothetical protein